MNTIFMMGKVLAGMRNIIAVSVSAQALARLRGTL
jgi:hypothetical protein